MYEIVEEIFAQELADARAEAAAEAEKKDLNNIRLVMWKFHISVAEAMDLFEIPEESREKLLKKL